MSFRRKDQINHPAYGTGEVRKVIGSGDYAALEVYFPKTDTTRQLNAAWVTKNCAYIPYRPRKAPPSPVFQTGVYRESPSLSASNRQVFTEQAAVWTDLHRQGLAYMMANAAPGIHFAMIGARALVMLEPEEGDTLQQLEQAAWGHITRTLGTHPDFGCVELEDGGFVLTMNRDRLWLLVPPEHTVRTPEDRITLENLLSARAVLLENCRRKQILAIVKSIP